MSDLLKEAIELIEKQEYEKAIEKFELALEDNEENRAEIFNNIGVAYTNLNDLTKAEEYFTNSLKINPLFPQTYVNLSDLYYKKKEIEHAIEILLQGEGFLPKNVVLPHYLARIYMEDARLDLAIDELDKVLEAQPENYDAYYDLAKIYFELGNWEAAISNFENVLEYVQNNALIYYYLGQAYEANDEIDKAISNHLKALTINQQFHPAYKKLGILFMARGDYADAKEYLEDYLKLDIPQEEINNTNKILERIKVLENE